MTSERTGTIRNLFPSAAAATVAMLLSLPSSSLPAGAVEIVKPSSVVEFFTSQGCSSCPPADRVLADLSGMSEVLALGWHVDYWDYLGWKDTFALPQASKRQKAYAASLGTRGVYTPQAIINGVTDIVGSRGQDVMAAVRRNADAATGLPVDIEVSHRDGVIEVRVPAIAMAEGSMLWMVYYDQARKVRIEGGENKGQEFVYSNIVRDMEMIGMVSKEPLQAAFPVEELARRGFDACALVLQKKKRRGTPGPIVGAVVFGDISQ